MDSYAIYIDPDTLEHKKSDCKCVNTKEACFGVASLLPYVGSLHFFPDTLVWIAGLLDLQVKATVSDIFEGLNGTQCLKHLKVRYRTITDRVEKNVRA
ncbi:hypothetical protein X798_02190 [Onchocerca flexuosa]|uniref:Octopine_DH domain-containing protein n=2 Tax=Onchocerca flexuosa TaxID=387005 RepID=A0A183HZT6_9BILA|nr:hypothetical protein X798_02190 [Onchocerca flexuosa]VDP12681.1 unnamed protein product [Onchocerca flexuosa]